MRKLTMWIGICMLILLVGCSSSYDDCHFDCKHYKYQCTIVVSEWFKMYCLNYEGENITDNIDRINYLCYEECRGISD